MLRWSLVFLGIAAVIGLVGQSGIAGYTWIRVKPAFFVCLLVPLLTLLVVALRKSFAAHTMREGRAFFLIIMVSILLAFLL